MIDSGGGGSELYLGLEIGGTKLQVFTGDAGARIVERHRFQVEPASGGAGIRAQLEQIIPALAKRIRPAAVGLGFGGPVDWKTGQICCSHQIEGWSDFPLAAWLSELAEAPVMVDNDANLGALGEATCGAGAGFNPVFYVTLGSGVGGGLVVDGKVFHGAPPGESEIGHVRLDRAGTLVESRCSGWAVDAKIRAAIARNPDSTLARCVGKAGAHEAKFLNAALSQKDPLAAVILEETAEDLAFGLSHVVHLFHPSIIVLGGGLALVGEPLRAAVERVAPRFVMEAFAPGPRIALAKLAEDAVPVGALCLALARPSA
ncbi:MAG TPA: ROK family protein [Verrucomicrobiae bacterium]|jgi:glucokinase|nr:ROK family protein [Verrucomicrobiae bacterium]